MSSNNNSWKSYRKGLFNYKICYNKKIRWLNKRNKRSKRYKGMLLVSGRDCNSWRGSWLSSLLLLLTVRGWGRYKILVIILKVRRVLTATSASRKVITLRAITHILLITIVTTLIIISTTLTKRLTLTTLTLTTSHTSYPTLRSPAPALIVNY